MKILLVRPALPSKAIIPYPPVGLLTLAPYLKKDNDVRLCDLQAGHSLDDGLRWNPDLAAVTCYSFTMQDAYTTVESIRAKSKVKVIVGGPGVTADPEYASSVLNNADAFIAGDGETFAEELPNLDLEGIVHVPFFDMKNKLLPSWDMIDTGAYKRFPGLAVESSRGCSRQCIFCTAHLTAGIKYRPRPPEDVVKELQFLHSKYKVRYFYFPDDNIALNPKRFRDLLHLMIEADLKSKFNVWEGIQAHHLDYDTLKLMHEARFESITLGAESGCQRVVETIIGKGLRVDWVREVVKNAKKIGLMVNCFFVIGIPGETLDEAKMTVDFAQELRGLGAYSCIVRNALPMRGTRMFEIAKREGYLTESEEHLREAKFVHSGKHFMRTPEWEPEQIEELVRKAMKQDATHIMKHHFGRLVKLAVIRSFTEPKRVSFRARQLWSEFRGRGLKDVFKRDNGE